MDKIVDIDFVDFDSFSRVINILAYNFLICVL